MTATESIRVVVVGNSGSGKSTFARALAVGLGVSAIELDSIFHQPGWTMLQPEEFRARVKLAMETELQERNGWVVDGNYFRFVGDLTLDAANVVVWFDLHRARVMWQLTKRTIRRVCTQEELWNGNTERWHNLVKWSPEENILRWAWTQHGTYREKIRTAASTSTAHWVRIRNPRQRESALKSLLKDYA